MIEFGKWYTYHRGLKFINWEILPVCMHDDIVFSLYVYVKDGNTNVHLDITVGIPWFTNRLGKSLTLSTDPPSFSNIRLSYKQKEAIFNTIFGSKND